MRSKNLILFIIITIGAFLIALSQIQQPNSRNYENFQKNDLFESIQLLNMNTSKEVTIVPEEKNKLFAILKNTLNPQKGSRFDSLGHFRIMVVTSDGVRFVFDFLFSNDGLNRILLPGERYESKELYDWFCKFNFFSKK